MARPVSPGWVEEDGVSDLVPAPGVGVLSSLTTQDGGSNRGGGSLQHGCALTWWRREQGSNPRPRRGGGSGEGGVGRDG